MSVLYKILSNGSPNASRQNTPSNTPRPSRVGGLGLRVNTGTDQLEERVIPSKWQCFLPIDTRELGAATIDDAKRSLHVYLSEFRGIDPVDETTGAALYQSIGSNITTLMRQLAEIGKEESHLSLEDLVPILDILKSLPNLPLMTREYRELGQRLREFLGRVNLEINIRYNGMDLSEPLGTDARGLDVDMFLFIHGLLRSGVSMNPQKAVLDPFAADQLSNAFGNTGISEDLAAELTRLQGGTIATQAMELFLASSSDSDDATEPIEERGTTPRSARSRKGPFSGTPTSRRSSFGASPKSARLVRRVSSAADLLAATPMRQQLHRKFSSMRSMSSGTDDLSPPRSVAVSPGHKVRHSKAEKILMEYLLELCRLREHIITGNPYKPNTLSTVLIESFADELNSYFQSADPYSDEGRSESYSRFLFLQTRFVRHFLSTEANQALIARHLDAKYRVAIENSVQEIKRFHADATEAQIRQLMESSVPPKQSQVDLDISAEYLSSMFLSSSAPRSLTRLPFVTKRALVRTYALLVKHPQSANRDAALRSISDSLERYIAQVDLDIDLHQQIATEYLSSQVALNPRYLEDESKHFFTHDVYVNALLTRLIPVIAVTQGEKRLGYDILQDLNAKLRPFLPIVNLRFLIDIVTEVAREHTEELEILTRGQVPKGFRYLDHIRSNPQGADLRPSYRLFSIYKSMARAFPELRDMLRLIDSENLATLTNAEYKQDVSEPARHSCLGMISLVHVDTLRTLVPSCRQSYLYGVINQGFDDTPITDEALGALKAAYMDIVAEAFRYVDSNGAADHYVEQLCTAVPDLGATDPKKGPQHVLKDSLIFIRDTIDLSKVDALFIQQLTRYHLTRFFAEMDGVSIKIADLNWPFVNYLRDKHTGLDDTEHADEKAGIAKQLRRHKHRYYIADQLRSTIPALSGLLLFLDHFDLVQNTSVAADSESELRFAELTHDSVQESKDIYAQDYLRGLTEIADSARRNEVIDRNLRVTCAGAPNLDLLIDLHQRSIQSFMDSGDAERCFGAVGVVSDLGTLDV